MNDFNIESNDIAIIGMACSFPKGNSLEEYWESLRSGRSGIAHFTKEELMYAGVDASTVDNPDYVRSQGYLDNIDLFDADFFTMSALEASVLDPQQRLLMEKSWEAMEHAGYDPVSFPGQVGVYVGCATNSYLLQNLLTPSNSAVEKIGTYNTMLLSSPSSLSTRISYKLNLKGPSLTIQTACSTSLVALHMACKSLQVGDCDMALTGAASLLTLEKQGYLYDEGMILSKDGVCRPFDENATGTISGNGGGVLILKMAEEAVEDRDTIHAVIKGSAVNNDGSDKLSFTAPSVEGQYNVIREALEEAELEAGDIDYIEAHGTGTKIGDPIEFEALRKIFEEDTDKRGFCSLGSVKANIGHLDAAAGMAGIIKLILALKHDKIPPLINFQSPNPLLDIESSPFYITTELTDWPQRNAPPRAGISSLGVGGTNAHVILQKALVNIPKIQNRENYLIVLSAKTENSLKRYIESFIAHLHQYPDQEMGNIAFTLQVGRSMHPCRAVFLCQGREDLIRQLEHGLYGEAVDSGIGWDSSRWDTQKIATEMETVFFEHIEAIERDDFQEIQGLLLKIIPENGAQEVLLAGTEKSVLTMVGALWKLGVAIPWELLSSGKNLSRIPLPTYAFEKKRYWISGSTKSDRNASSLPTNEESPILPTETFRSEQQILTKVELLLKEFLEVETINADSGFFELGGDSVLSVNFIHSINEVFGVQLSSGILYEADTPRKLTDHLVEDVLPPVGEAALPAPIRKLKEGPADSSPLIVIHTIEGGLAMYEYLVEELAENRSVYGIQGGWSDSGNKPYDNLISQAKEYISMIKKIQENGPYFVGGASFGGVLAYEIVHQLLNQGEEIGLFFMIDSPVPGPENRMSPSTLRDEKIRFLASRDGLRQESAEKMDLDDLEKLPEGEKEALLETLLNGMPHHEKKKWLLVEKELHTNNQYLEGYQVAEVKHESIYFFNDETPPSQLEFWKNHLKKGEFVLVSGNHFTMNFHPNGQKICSVLNTKMTGPKVIVN